MTKIIIHNPCNEHTKRFRYYNYFWDKFTEFLKTKFDVKENRFFSHAHEERFKVNLKKGTSDNFMLLECEYVIENEENGEFVILSVADNLGSATVSERDNPYQKKVLISQFIPDKIKHHSKKINYHKYSPWTYFQCRFDDLNFFYEKRRKKNELIDKMYFRGELNSRPIINFFSDNLYLNRKKISSEEYFDELINYEIGLSIAGAGEICYRDIEYMALGIPFIRYEYQTQIYPPLIPNYHYISIPYDLDIPKDNDVMTDRLGTEKHTKKIEDRFNEVIKNKKFLNFISKNARKYYEDNLVLEKLIESTYALTGIEEWLDNEQYINTEINFWIYDDEFYIGDEYPKNKVTLDFIEENKEKIKPKNILAFDFFKNYISEEKINKYNLTIV